ncbi:MAG: S8 family serine peptidase [Candidatus Firestonebacteria bacterium]|nr:S8 family serine peptidase [Candidatus Firestonebacteria bacterium]
MAGGKRIGFLFVMGGVLGLTLAAAAQEPREVPMARSGTLTPAGWLVKYKTGSRLAQALSRQTGLAVLGIAHLAANSGTAWAAQRSVLQNNPDVLWAAPNYWRYAQAMEVVPNDPYYRPERNQRRYQQWHLPKLNANYAWSVTSGRNDLTVAVVDSGVDLNHPDLKNRLLPGVTLVHQDKYTPPAGGMDDNGHGTHVAGLIGAETYNGVGVAGIVWAGKILPVKVLNQDGAGTDADIAAGIVWAADQGARVINLALGGPSDDGTPPQALQDAVDYAYAHGCLVFAAAGNSGDNTRYYPAALAHVLGVGATDPWDRRASYSTWGPFVALSAPGGAGAEALTKDTGMLSTFWDANSAGTDTLGGSEAGEYGIEVGTSMAAAVASGAALLVWSTDPGMTPDQVADRLRATALDIGAPGPDQQTGAGRIDVLAALGNPQVIRPELTLYNYPNPFNPERETTQIVFLLDLPRGADLAVYDVARALVWKKHYTAAEVVAGKNLKIWDGKNGLGERVANGAYFMRVTTEDGKKSALKGIAVIR